MASFNPSKMTALGLGLLAKAQADLANIHFTKLKTGDGRHPDNSENLSGYTDLLSPRQSFPVAELSVINNSTVYCKVYVNNEGLEQGYHVREVGLFATDPDQGEILYAMATVHISDDGSEEADYLPAYNSYMPATIEIEFYTEVSNAESVTIEGLPEPEPAIKVYIDQLVSRLMISHNADTEAHPSLRPVTVEITVPVEAWQEDESGGDYGFSAMVDCEDAAVSNVPIVTLDKSCLKAAGDAGVCPTVEALDGSLHLWATAKPASELTGWVTLLGPGSGAGGGGISLPVATEDILGGIKASDSLTVDPDGTAHSVPDVATDQEVSDMLAQVFDHKSD